MKILLDRVSFTRHFQTVRHIAHSLSKALKLQQMSCLAAENWRLRKKLKTKQTNNNTY